MLIVEVSLFLVAKDFVRLCDGLELALGFISLVLRDLVGVMLERKLFALKVSILDIVLR